jgi:hypothetical protein
VGQKFQKNLIITYDEHLYLGFGEIGGVSSWECVPC